MLFYSLTRLTSFFDVFILVIRNDDDVGLSVGASWLYGIFFLEMFSVFLNVKGKLVRPNIGFMLVGCDMLN